MNEVYILSRKTECGHYETERCFDDMNKAFHHINPEFTTDEIDSGFCNEGNIIWMNHEFILHRFEIQ